jgi:hypothetical protein
MPKAIRQSLAVTGRAARWAVLPQDTRIVALGKILETDSDDPATLLRQQRLIAAQNLSEARSLMITRQLELTADFGNN